MIKKENYLTISDISKESIKLFTEIASKQLKTIEFSIKSEIGNVVIIETRFINIISKEDYKKIGVLMQSDIEKRMSDKNFDEMINNKDLLYENEVSKNQQDNKHA